MEVMNDYNNINVRLNNLESILRDNVFTGDYNRFSFKTKYKNHHYELRKKLVAYLLSDGWVEDNFYRIGNKKTFKKGNNIVDIWIFKESHYVCMRRDDVLQNYDSNQLIINVIGH